MDKIKGFVKSFNNDKGFGFIKADDGKDYFVHFSSIDGKGFKCLDAGEQVTFVPNKTEKGLNATQVVRLGVNP